mgnify:CR=1 FL=1
MKKVVALLLAIALSPVVMAQDRNVRLDLFGAANVVGASYDARFKGDSGLGFAVGVGYGFGIGNWYEIHGVGVPVEINYGLLYTSDDPDALTREDLGGRRII